MLKMGEKVHEAILKGFISRGWSAENITFGMSGALLQKLDRDIRPLRTELAIKRTILR